MTNTRILAGLVLLAGTGSFQACGDDEAAPSVDAGGGGVVIDGGELPTEDAGTSPPEHDASTPGTEPDDAGMGGNNGPEAAANGEPDGGNVALPPLVPRELCAVSGERLERYTFPTLERDSYVQLARVRSLAELSAVDPVHGEMFVPRNTDIGRVLDVFALDASGLDAPLRSIALHFDDGQPLAITYDADSETLLLLSSDRTQTYWISTYPRTATNEGSPIRRIEFGFGAPQGNFSPTYAIAVDAARQRVFVASDVLLRTFPLTATGPTDPLESTNRSASKLTISASRDELYLQGFDGVETYALGAPLGQPAIRSLSVLGNTLIDDVNDELWVTSVYGDWAVYDIEAEDEAEPLARGILPTARGRAPQLLAVLPERGELLAQVPSEPFYRSGSILVYERDRPAANAEPLRVLAASDGTPVIHDFVGMNRSRGEVFVRDQHNGFISAYPLGATELAQPLRHLGPLAGGTAVDAPGTAYFEAAGLMFAAGAPPVGVFPAFTPIGVYQDAATGLVSPDREAARDLSRLAVAAEPAELLGVKRAAYRGALPVLEAYSLDSTTFGVLQRTISIPSPRAVPALMWRNLVPLAVAHDSIRDEVVVAFRDCIEFDGGLPGDCHFDLKLFPRNAGVDTAIETVELAHSVLSLAFDEQNDLLLVHGDNGLSFYPRPQLTSARGQLGVAGEPLISSPEFIMRGDMEGHVAVGYCD